MTVVKVILIVILIMALLYFYAIMPRKRRPEVFSRNTRYYAHRGLFDNSGSFPENSAGAFKKAVNAGYGIELDVQMSKDGVPVVIHDFTLERPAGKPGRVADYTFDELKSFSLFGSEERIPSFREVLEIVGGRVPLIIELKVERTDLSVCDAVWELLKDYRGEYCVESFNPLPLRWFRRRHPEVARGQLSDNFMSDPQFRGKHTPFMWAMQMMMANFLSRPDFIAYNHLFMGNLSRRLCRHLFGAYGAAWTIKSDADFNRAKDEFDVFIFDSYIPTISA